MKTIKILLVIMTISGILIYSKNDLYEPLEIVPVIDKIVVIKHKRKMHLYEADSIIRTYNIALGKVPSGKKQFEGDLKTPEGSYIINDKNPNSAYYKNLGISYPNQDDIDYARQHNRSPGGHIKIHGLKNNSENIGQKHIESDWTEGCIAVTNEEMDELYRIIQIGTMILIKP